MRLRIPVGLAVVILSVAGCAGGFVGYSGGYEDGDDGPAYDYDMPFYEPGFDYGWWGGGEYFGGPPIYEYRGGRGYWRGHDGRPGGHGRGVPYHAAPPSRAVPSIPRVPRGGGFRGGRPGGGRPR